MTVTNLRRVLLIDDEPMLRRALRRVLCRRFEVVAIGDAREALAGIAAGERFDAIVSDLMMPGMNGMEFHRALAVVAPELVARVVFVTGEVLAPSVAAFLDGVPNTVLRKPFGAAVLVSALDAAASGRPFVPALADSAA